MRDPKRINPIIERLRALWLSQPDLRFSQLFINIINTTAPDIFYLEDDKFEEMVEAFEKRFDDAGTN